MIKIKEGMKLKVIKGDDDIHGNPTNKGLWIAGEIEVGTIGTVYKAALKGRDSWMFALDFPGGTPKAGYIFGIGGGE